MSKYKDESGVLLAWVVVTVAIIFALFLIGTLWKFAPEVEQLQAEQKIIDCELDQMQSEMDDMWSELNEWDGVK
jgi:sensor domain CHASE-containing protein